MRSDLAIPGAILIGAAVIGLAIVGAQLVAPYRIAGTSEGVWRLDTVTGDARACLPAKDPKAELGVYCRW